MSPKHRAPRLTRPCHMGPDLQLQQRQRTSSSASEDSLKLQSSGALAESGERSTSLPTLGQRKSKNLNPFSSGSSQKGGAAEPQSQIPSRLLNLAKPKEKEKKKKKKGKGQQSQNTGCRTLRSSNPDSRKPRVMRCRDRRMEPCFTARLSSSARFHVDRTLPVFIRRSYSATYTPPSPPPLPGTPTRPNPLDFSLSLHHTTPRQHSAGVSVCGFCLTLEIG
ncbi:hypothetical protein NFI96_025856 [Prochilodus magdalenae]|nr:hypothetical protein NFI96_025856 [Prochilodus magdalenae]